MRTSTIFHQILSEKEYFKKWKNIRKWQWTKKEQKDTWRLEFFFRNFGCQKKMSRRILKWIAILHLSPPDTQSRNSQRSPLFLFAGTQFIFAGNPGLCDVCTASGVLASRIPDMCSDCLINAMAIDWAGFDRWRTLFGSHTVCNSPGDRMAFIQMVCVDPTESDRSPARWMGSVLTEFLVAQLRQRISTFAFYVPMNDLTWMLFLSKFVNSVIFDSASQAAGSSYHELRKFFWAFYRAKLTFFSGPRTSR